MEPKNTEESSLHGYSVRVNDAMRLRILPTANAWWKDRNKTQKLVDAVTRGLKIREACAEADISLAQYKYFARCHPKINQIRKMYRVTKVLRGRLSTAEPHELNPVLADKYQKLLQKVSILEENNKNRGREIGSLRSSLTQAQKKIKTLQERLMPDPDVLMTKEEIAEWSGANYPSFTFGDYERLLETFHPDSAEKIREEWFKNKEVYRSLYKKVPTLGELERQVQEAKAKRNSKEVG